MSKRVIVSGVTGQDGSYMVDYLLKNTDHEIWGMVRRTSKPDLSNLKAAIGNQRFKTIVGDLADSASIDNVVKEVKPDYFINLAAQSFVGSSWTIPEQTFDIDAVGVIRCLEAIRKHVPHCRFYNAGSSEEHGNVQYTPQDIDHPPCARSPYGAAKVAARQIVKVYRESYGLYAVQGLLFNHESERRGEEFVTRKITLGVARIAKAIKEGKAFEPIELGNIDAKRDWSHAEDFVEGIWLMLNQDKHRADLQSVCVYGVSHWRDGLLQPNHPEIVADQLDCDRRNAKIWAPLIHEYVLSSGETHTVRAFIEKAFEAADIKGFWVGEDVNEFYGFEKTPSVGVVPFLPLIKINPAFYRPNDVELLLGDSMAARKELGWAPKVSFDQLVERMVKSDLAGQGII